MSKQFYHHYFALGDVSSPNYLASHNPRLPDSNDKALVIVNMDGTGAQDRMVGLDRSINEDDSGGFAPSFLGVKNSCPTFTIQVACLSKSTGEALSLTPDEMFYLNKYLFKDYYQELRIYGANYGSNDINEQELSWTDLIYYVICTRATQYNVSNGRGYIELEFRLDSPCAYSPQMEAVKTVTGNNFTISIEAKFNVGDYIYPDIQFRLPNGSGNVTIKNLTTNQTMQFNNVPQNNIIYCYNEGYKYVQNQTNQNAYSMGMLDPNSEWIALADGMNTIEVYVSGTNGIETKFIYQNKIAIQ